MRYTPLATDALGPPRPPRPMPARAPHVTLERLYINLCERLNPIAYQVIQMAQNEYNCPKISSLKSKNANFAGY